MNKTELKAYEAGHILQVRLLKDKLDKVQKVLRRLHANKERLENELREEEHAVHVFQERILAREGVPVDILTLRQEIIFKVKLASGKDITIREKERLEAEICVSQLKLKETCRHRFVLSYDGYGGSYTRDYDDACHGERVCVVCEFVETEEECGSEKYKVLQRAEDRLIKRDLRVLKFLGRRQIWRPMEEYFEMFYQSAGCINACWPKAKTPKGEK